MEKNRVVRNPWLIVLLIAVLCCLIAWGAAAVSNNLADKDGLGEYKTINIVNIQDLQATQDGFVYYDGNTVSALSSSGKVIPLL